VPVRRRRDSKRSAAYAAEREVRARLGGGQPLSELADLSDYAGRLVGSAWWARRWPDVARVDVTDGRGRRSGTTRQLVAGRGEIAMPRFARNELYLLHELAHVAAQADSRVLPVDPSHSRGWAAIFLELVRHQMGDDHWSALKDEFSSRNVRHTHHRARTVTATVTFTTRGYTNAETAEALRRALRRSPAVVDDDTLDVDVHADGPPPRPPGRGG
jgi:putative metallohydrolase (TIGR04338 family)